MSIPRGPGGRWLPGHGSPNPGHKLRRVTEAREIALEETPEAFKRVIEMAKNDPDSRVRHACDKLLIAYGIGDPPKTIEVETGRSDDAMDALTVEELRALAKQSLADDTPETDADDGDDADEEPPH